MSNVRKILCHAEFPCGNCGQPYLTMALAPVEHLAAGGVEFGEAVRCGEDTCQVCRDAEVEASRKAYNRQQAQRRWVRRYEKNLRNP